MLSAVSGTSPYSVYNIYGAAFAGHAVQGAEKAQAVQRPALIQTAQRAAQPGVPVQPVTPVRPVDADMDPARQALLRQGSDPVEMAVRMRIQYPGSPGAQEDAGAPEAQEENAVQGSKSAREVMEEGECQTCKERKYQDGSDDPGVSFKTPTNIDPDRAAAAVRGHENEHVVREQAKARQEDRKVVSQSVTYHTDICPECGRVYVSGGTTRTVTSADNNRQEDAQQQGQDSSGSPSLSAA